ncbi:DsbE family thiol:disulfide interchange protein [Pseudoduganella ginsengisoli]|uniref:DsbE family thiol:disulfide interchange protein n=1 Tax=Pseudoduganella ginsengisoli TaxID=1462440 RepID=A0A6L6PXX1_9BURK|nr:DsbE family thiol:disulfide interchange protein [Pseudoduganella ginsengisoli]MTW01552.1 DsbE family thiol:disulfide interchange protein [Pseudoduganella ginsengisoli]
MKRYFPAAVFAALLVLLGAGLRLKPDDKPSALAGKAAPAFTLQRIGAPGPAFQSQQMAGKVWLLNVWASWCGPCRAEHPVLVDLAKQGVAPIVGLNYTDKLDESGRWLAEHGNPYTAAVFDGDGRVGMDWGVVGVPETFVIDKQGHIRMRHVGPVTQEVVRDKLLPLVKELERA